MPEYNARIDYYEVLQVHSRATPAVIKAAYRVIVRELRAHPDLGGKEDFAKLANEAYRVLGDPEVRRAYDGARLVVASSRGEESGLEQIVVCAGCGRSNSLPLGTDARRTRCSFCDALLQGTPASVPPEPRENAFDLPPGEYQLLCRHGQVDCRAEEVRSGETLRCRFCGNEWRAEQSGRPPRACRVCDRADWQAFRVLKCRACGHEWRSSRLGGWAYRDHPRCPNCLTSRWSKYCESHPLGWFLGLLRR